MTGREACELISSWLEEKHGVVASAEQIWSMSPSGELWHIGALLERASADGYKVAGEAA